MSNPLSYREKLAKRLFSRPKVADGKHAPVESPRSNDSGRRVSSSKLQAVWSRMGNLQHRAFIEAQDHSQSHHDLQQVFIDLVGEEGKINETEFVDLCQNLDLNLSTNELRRIFLNICNGSETIGMADFIDAVKRSRFLRCVISSYARMMDEGFDIPAGYDYAKSTEQNYENPNKTDFHGQYADIRKLLDYSHHVNYTKERQLWQDRVITACVIRNDPQPRPWIVFTFGPMGAGKGYALSWLSLNGYFPLEQIVHIDPDHFKQTMPEWEGYVHAGSRAGALCHKESGFMSEIAREAAIANWQHIWVGGSLRNADYNARVLDDLRLRFPHYHVAIFYVYCTKETAWKRCQARAEKTGRAISPERFEKSFLLSDQTLARLTPKVDFLARINNEGSTPVLDAFEVVDRSGHFLAIERQFANTHPSPNLFPQSLAPMRVQATGVVHPQLLVDKVHLEDSHVGRIRGELFPGKLGNKHLDTLLDLLPRLRAVSRGDGDGDADGDGDGEGRGEVKLEVEMSPKHSVNLDNKSRELASIPESAMTFAWMYACVPLAEIEERFGADVGGGEDFLAEHKEVDCGDPVVRLVLHGGFVYFDLDDQVVATNAVGSFLVSQGSVAGQSATNFLQFTPGQTLRPKIARHLEWNNRWKPVTISALRRQGAELYTWIRPGEKLLDKRLTRFGAFAFTLHREAESAKAKPQQGSFREPSHKVDVDHAYYFPVASV